ncbi:hypothetical protein BH23PLA1_BH23PLA1_01820 [soil metagenome]
MKSSSPRAILNLFPLSLGVSAALLVAATASAQFHGNPFDPYQAAYRSSSLPRYSIYGPLSNPTRVATPPGLGVVPGFEGFTPNDRFFGGAGAGAEFGPLLGGARAGSDPLSLFPADRALRQYDEEFGRIYRPNTFGPGGSVDEEYFKSRKQREDLYFRAMSESDPRRKAELLQQYRQASEQAALGLSRQTRARTGAAADRRGTSGATSPSATGTGTTAVPEPTDAAPGTIETYDDLLRQSVLIDLALSRALKSDSESSSTRESLVPTPPEDR